MATDSDRAYEEWLRAQLTQLQSQQQTTVQPQPQRVREPMPPYRTVEYTPPPKVAETTVTKAPSIDWRTVLGWTLVLGATAATFNIMLYSIKSVCPAHEVKQSVVAPPKPTKPKPQPGNIKLLPVPQVPPLPPSAISPFNGKPLSSFMPNSK